jgi:hypothetical protein
LLGIVRGVISRGNRSGTAFVLVELDTLCRPIHENIHSLGFRWILKHYLVPARAAAGEHGLAIKNAIALKSGDLNPAPLTMQTRDLLAVNKGNAFHMLRNRLLRDRRNVGGK